MNLLPLVIFLLIALFHFYMGLGLPYNTKAVLPRINGEDLPFHRLMAIPVGVVFLITSWAFSVQIGLILVPYSMWYTNLLWAVSIALVVRGALGLIVFHLLNGGIDPTPFKTWDRYLYSPLTLYLGVHCLLILLS